MAIYMKYGTFNGDVSTTGFEKWIELSSLQWGVGRAIGSAASSAKTRESTNPSISEVTVTKLMDSSSTHLFTDAVAGKLNTTVQIKLTTTTGSTVVDYLNYELTNCGISSYSISSGGDLPSESLSLNFTKVSFTFKGTDPAVASNPDTVGYDLTTMHTV